MERGPQRPGHSGGLPGGVPVALAAQPQPAAAAATPSAARPAGRPPKAAAQGGFGEAAVEADALSECGGGRVGRLCQCVSANKRCACGNDCATPLPCNGALSKAAWAPHHRFSSFTMYLSDAEGVDLLACMAQERHAYKHAPRAVARGMHLPTPLCHPRAREDLCLSLHLLT